MWERCVLGSRQFHVMCEQHLRYGLIPLLGCHFEDTCTLGIPLAWSGSPLKERSGQLPVTPERRCEIASVQASRI
jgi:hypothetical protein